MESVLQNPKMSYQEMVVVRKNSNKLINRALELYQDIFSDLRYMQYLYLMGLTTEEDRFYEEPYQTVKKILPNIQILINKKFPKKATLKMKICRWLIFNLVEELKLGKKGKNSTLELF